MKEKTETKDILNKKYNIEELDKCISAPHAEMARNTDEDEPCDDGRT
jgi:hypothetical protein